MTVPGMFIPKATTVRVWCDITDKETGEKPYDGLWADVRRNLTNGERQEFRNAAQAIDDRGNSLLEARQEASGAHVAAMKEAEGDVDRQRDLIAQEIAGADEFFANAEALAFERFELVAPHVHAWNLAEIGDDGEAIAIPAPRDGGMAVMASITSEIVRWLLDATMQAYRMGFAIGSRKSGATPEPTPEPSAEKRTAKPSSSRQSRRKSSSLDPSTSGE